MKTAVVIHTYYGENAVVATLRFPFFTNPGPINEEDLYSLLETAYRLTNTIEEPWYENDEIDVAEEALTGCRSTSVGDVIVLDKVPYQVANAGWKKLKLNGEIENTFIEKEPGSLFVKNVSQRSIKVRDLLDQLGIEYME